MERLDELIGSAAVLIDFGDSIVIAVACLRGLAVMTVGRGTHLAIFQGRLLIGRRRHRSVGL